MNYAERFRRFTGVPFDRSADAEQHRQLLKRCRQRAAQRLHPDRCGGDGGEFVRMSAEYQHLCAALPAQYQRQYQRQLNRDVYDVVPDSIVDRDELLRREHFDDYWRGRGAAAGGGKVDNRGCGSGCPKR